MMSESGEKVISDVTSVEARVAQTSDQYIHVYICHAYLVSN